MQVQDVFERQRMQFERLADVLKRGDLPQPFNVDPAGSRGRHMGHEVGEIAGQLAIDLCRGFEDVENTAVSVTTAASTVPTASRREMTSSDVSRFLSTSIDVKARYRRVTVVVLKDWTTETFGVAKRLE